MRSVYVAGHRGLLGSAIWRNLSTDDYHLIGASREELDLREPAAVESCLARKMPGAVVLTAAKVGGIEANRVAPADFIAENLAIALNVMTASARLGIERLIFVASSAIYPPAERPLTERDLMSGPLHPSVESYATAKIAGIKLAQAIRRQTGLTYHTVVPTNLYGTGDNYHPEHSHVVAGMIRKFHEAKHLGDSMVTLWGTGNPMRQLLHADDAAQGVKALLEQPNPPDLLNLGGEELAIRDLAEKVSKVVGYDGEVRWDQLRPDGAMRKALDDSEMRVLGWSPTIDLDKGLRQAYADFVTRFGT